MPSRYYRRNFIKGYFYHIYNRGANKSVVFFDQEDYITFIEILAYYLTFPLGKPLSLFNRTQNKVRNLTNELKPDGSISLCVYCLMPNHFHLIIKQVEDDLKTKNVSNLMRRLTITYAMYFTKKYNHSGTLFQSKFKNILVDSNIQLAQLSKYIHRNPIENQGSEPLHKYEYSSYPFYIGMQDNPNWVNTQEILSLFARGNAQTDYLKFVEDDQSPNLPETITLEPNNQGSEP